MIYYQTYNGQYIVNISMEDVTFLEESKLLESYNRFAIEYSFDDQPEYTSVKSLGVLCDHQSDYFQYKLKIIDKTFYGKQDNISLISKIFVPLGLIGLVVTKAKIFM